MAKQVRRTAKQSITNAELFLQYSEDKVKEYEKELSNLNKKLESKQPTKLQRNQRLDLYDKIKAHYLRIDLLTQILYK